MSFSTVWKFLSPILQPIWGTLFKFVPYIAALLFGKKQGITKEQLKHSQDTTERYKQANEIQSRPLLSLAAVIKRLRKNKKS